MEPDPLIARSPGTTTNKKINNIKSTSSSLSSASTSMPSILMGCGRSNNSNNYNNNNNIKSKSGINVVVCVLCLVCVTASVYNVLREAILEERLTFLENKVASLEEKTMKNLDVIIERFRRDAENRFKQRVTREVASEHHLIMGLKRTPRDAHECICPAGKSYFFLPFFLFFFSFFGFNSFSLEELIKLTWREDEEEEKKKKQIKWKGFNTI